MSASRIRDELSEYHACLVLACALNDQQDERHNRLRELLNQAAAFIDTATSRNIKEQGKPLLQMLKQAVEANNEILPRRKFPRQIARDFRDLGAQTDVWRLRVPYGRLQERFDHRRVPTHYRLPQRYNWHGRSRPPQQ